MGHIIGLEAAYDLSEDWRVGGAAQIAIENRDAAIDLPGYEVLNLYTEYTPAQFENVKIRFDIANVFDETYSRRSSDGIDSTRVIPLTEPGRTFGVTATVNF